MSRNGVPPTLTSFSADPTTRMTLPQLIGARVVGEYRLWLSYDDGRQGEQAFVDRASSRV